MVRISCSAPHPSVRLSRREGRKEARGKDYASPFACGGRRRRGKGNGREGEETERKRGERYGMKRKGMGRKRRERER